MRPDQFKGLKIGAALRAGGRLLTGAQTSLLDARVLLKKATGLSETELIVSDSEVIKDAAAEKYETFLRRRREGEPVSYITGVKEFWSLAFEVTPAVLIPAKIQRH